MVAAPQPRFSVFVITVQILGTVYKPHAGDRPVLLFETTASEISVFRFRGEHLCTAPSSQYQRRCHLSGTAVRDFQQCEQLKISDRGNDDKAIR